MPTVPQHKHRIFDVYGLQAALELAAIGGPHTHIIAEIIGLQLALDGRVDKTFTAGTTLDTLVPGHLARVTTAGNVRLTDASAINTASCIGFVTAATAIGFVPELTNNKITLADWTAITGAVSLSVGVRYFADPATPGKMTTTPPTTVGSCITSVGIALSTTTLDIEISDPILL